MECKPPYAAREAGPLDAPIGAQAQVAREPVQRWVGRECVQTYDELAVEGPLQIRLAGEDVAVTMRTPRHDFELAAGFLYTEGIIRGTGHIAAITFCADATGPSARSMATALPPTAPCWRPAIGSATPTLRPA